MFLLDDSRKDPRATNRSLNNSSSSFSVSKRLEFDSPSNSLKGTSSISEKKSLAVSQAICVRDGSFGWKTTDPAILEDISLDIEFGKLTMLVGPVASGKSSLLKALLGELPKATGSVYVARRRIAFCDQTPWITSSTVQRTILGFSAYDRDWYKTVVHACVLDQDIATLPDGDQSMVGSNGINLSGGQKQRVVSPHHSCGNFTANDFCYSRQ